MSSPPPSHPTPPRIQHVSAGGGGVGAPTGKAVAELPFGFWRYLLARRYLPTLWPVIRHRFPHLPRAQAHRTLERDVIDLHQLRNRLAHHEPLIPTPIASRRASLRAVLDAVDPQMSARALDDGGRLTALIRNHPRVVWLQALLIEVPGSAAAGSAFPCRGPALSVS